MSLNGQDREQILREHFLSSTQGSTSTGQSQSSVSSSTDNQNQFEFHQSTQQETQENLNRYATEYFERQNQITNIHTQYKHTYKVHAYIHT